MSPKYVAAIALVAFSATGAFAKSTPLQATLTTAPKQSETIASSIIWRCDGTNCVSASDTSAYSDFNACRGLSKALGPITAFTSSKGPFNQAQLDKCNGKK